MKDRKKIVMCFGTYDILHKGHLNFLKQAKKKGDYLIVVIARDKNVKKIKNRNPYFNEKERLEIVKNLKIVNKAVLGSEKDRYKVIRKYKPQIICLGYDQKTDIKKIKSLFPNIKIFRLKAYKPNIYKSSKIKEKFKTIT